MFDFLSQENGEMAKGKNECVNEYTYIHMYIYIHTMEYYSIKKNEILPFVRTWMDPKGIMHNKITQTKTNNV